MDRRRKPSWRAVAELHHAAAQAAIGRHRQHCGQCHTALRSERPDRCCDTGWELVKDERREHAQLRAALTGHERSQPVQLTLFG